MSERNQSSGRRGWVIGVVCVVLLIWMFNQHSSRSASSPSGDDEQVPAASSTDVVPGASSEPPEHSSGTFAGYDCTDDCGGHEAGYKWAEEHDIDNEDDCDQAGDTSNSPSFAEGCKAYVNGESPDEDDGGGNASDPDDPQNSALVLRRATVSVALSLIGAPTPNS